MLRRAKKTKPARATPGWVAWAVIAGVALILCVGLAVGAMQWMGGGSSTSRSAASPAATTHTTAAPNTSNRAQQDAIANRPMPEGDSTNMDATNFRPKPEVQATTPDLVLPKSTRTEAGVATGFPKTPEGAVAQLAALNVATYNNLDVNAGRAAYTAFAMPGAVGLADWNATKMAMRYYADNPSTDPTRMRATFTPVQGLIKGSVGDSWTLACVNGQVLYAYNGDSNRIGVWDCARMQWDDGKKRWMLAPGPNPARAPLTWPRDELSYRAGFRDLQNVPN